MISEVVKLRKKVEELTFRQLRIMEYTAKVVRERDSLREKLEEMKK